MLTLISFAEFPTTTYVVDLGVVVVLSASLGFDRSEFPHALHLLALDLFTSSPISLFSAFSCYICGPV